MCMCAFVEIPSELSWDSMQSNGSRKYDRAKFKEVQNVVVLHFHLPHPRDSVPPCDHLYSSGPANGNSIFIMMFIVREYTIWILLRFKEKMDDGKAPL
ncbi:unnamed protein product [Allacma fusca]|uniref:Uncharacterized protein n=1 Tax=Allacma fusca TaxID=39272 RepID=A0A8J2PQ98_9HEXA|nr:unnamed protein product [Allacma fusca]